MRFIDALCASSGIMVFYDHYLESEKLNPLKTWCEYLLREYAEIIYSCRVSPVVAKNDCK